MMLLLLVLVLALALTACGGRPIPEEDRPDAPVTDENTPEDGVSEDTLTVTDHDGNTVRVPANVQRIVVCDIYPLPSVLTVFFDSAEKIVGMAEPSMIAAKNGLLSQMYPEILQAETGFINGTEVNTEELLKLKPDVVFYSAGSDQIGEQLRNAGLAAVAVSASKWDYDAIETLNHWIELLSQIFPENDRSQVVADYSQQVYDRVQAKVADLPEDQRQKVFFLFQYNDSMITTSGAHFFGQWWANAIGAKNVGEEMATDNSTQVTIEQVYKWNPQWVLITNFNAAQPDDLYNNTIGNYDWSAVEAVQAKQVAKMPLGMYRSYTCGVDTPVTLLGLAKTVYPELFADVDILQETKDYYQQVFGVTLTDDQASQIFAPPAEAAAFK